jgi:hypothetical protein
MTRQIFLSIFSLIVLGQQVVGQSPDWIWGKSIGNTNETSWRSIASHRQGHDHVVNYNMDTFYAGQDTGQNVFYFDYVPDTVLTYVYINGDWHQQEGRMDLDLNQDSIYDFTLMCKHEFSPGFSYTHFYINCLNGNQVVTVTDTSGDIYVNPLALGTQIDSCTSWSVSDSVPLGGDFWLSQGGQTEYWGPWNWVSSAYIGVRIFTSGDTTLGYIHIVKIGGFHIADFGVNHIHTAITEYETNNFCIIFPNPFHSDATLNTGNNFSSGTLKVYNSIGKLVKVQTINSQLVTISRNDLSNGVYFIRVYNDKKEWHGKIIVN